MTHVYTLANQVIDLRKQIADLKTRLDPATGRPVLLEAGALDERLGALQNQLVNTKVRANEDSLKFGMGVDGGLADLAQIVGGDADATPTEAATAQFTKLQNEVDGYTKRWSAIVTNDIPKFQKSAGNDKFGVLVLQPPPLSGGTK